MKRAVATLYSGKYILEDIIEKCVEEYVLCVNYINSY